MSFLLYIKSKIVYVNKKIKDRLRNYREFKKYQKKIKAMNLNQMIEVKEEGHTYLLFTETIITDQLRKEIIKAISSQSELSEKKTNNSQKESKEQQSFLTLDQVSEKKENISSISSKVAMQEFNQKKEMCHPSVSVPAILHSKMRSDYPHKHKK